MGNQPCGAVFVVGSPRSGTTFLGGAIGQLPGFRDAGEMTDLTVTIPNLMQVHPAEAASKIEIELMKAVEIGRPVVHSPEMVFLVPALLCMEIDAAVIHLVRDGRDVACSLIEKGWLANGVDKINPTSEEDAKALSEEWQLGPSARFWTEASRASEFPRVSEARRTAWAWRQHVSTGLRYIGAGDREGAARTVTIRYEAMCARPEETAAVLAPVLGVMSQELLPLLAQASTNSIGRWRHELSAASIRDVMDESSELLEALGYLD